MPQSVNKLLYEGEIFAQSQKNANGVDCEFDSSIHVDFVCLQQRHKLNVVEKQIINSRSFLSEKKILQ